MIEDEEFFVDPGKTTVSNAGLFLRLAIWTELRPLVFVVYNWLFTLIFLAAAIFTVVLGYYIDDTFQKNWLTALICSSSALIGITVAATKIRTESLFIDPPFDDEMLNAIKNQRVDNKEVK
jgi:hypothetical protein